MGKLLPTKFSDMEAWLDWASCGIERSGEKGSDNVKNNT